MTKVWRNISARRSSPSAASGTASLAEPLTRKSTLAYHRRQVSDLFKALADPTRRAILDELQLRNGQTLFELCVRLITNHGSTSTRQAISQHLDVLEAAGLVRTRREGRYKFHDLDTSPLAEIAERWPVPNPKE
jgi:DNA-binding transcriptional ArsR family regulator